MSEGLHCASQFYFDSLDLYELFSQAEDASGIVSKYISELASDQVVLDAGCSFGKITRAVSSNSKFVVGIDQSSTAIMRAKQLSNSNNLHYEVGNIEAMKFNKNTFDLTYSSWVLGTILDLKVRGQALQQMQRVTKRNQMILLVENAPGSEFEYIRGRAANDYRTNQYNTWLQSQGFVLRDCLETYFQFDRLETARQVFSKIWGEQAGQRVVCSKIQHLVSIFVKLLAD